jgi:hypothetical protein
VIKTTIAGEDLTHALDRQQRYVDAHPDDVPTPRAPETPRPSHAYRITQRLLAAEKLRMAKARLKGR